jgi:hypothetical protein
MGNGDCCRNGGSWGGPLQAAASYILVPVERYPMTCLFKGGVVGWGIGAMKGLCHRGRDGWLYGDDRPALVMVQPHHHPT